MKPVKIGILGLGTVAEGTVNVLQRNAREITRRAGRSIQIKTIVVRDLNKDRHCDISSINLTTNPYDLLDDPELDVILELIGGETLAKDLVLKAIAQKKHVITANKALIAKHGNEIFSAAQKNGVMVAFEAAVAGGVPVIKAIREGLAGNRIQWMAGIINGTCNYILTEMKEKGKDFSEALSEAQSRGYAEADPTFDIEGIDVAHKLTILASIAFGIPLQFNRIHIEGITHVTRQDIIYAEQLGYSIKHLGIAKCNDQGIELRVHPTLIPLQHTMAHINGVMNALLIMADAVGPTLYYGAGAGSEPTASSVVADLVDVVRTLTVDSDNRVPHLAFQPDALEDLPILDVAKIHTAYYLRILAVDKPGVLADITKILGDLDISIESILQKEREREEGYIPVVIITQVVLENNMDKAIHAIEALSGVKDNVVRLRLEHLNG